MARKKEEPDDDITPLYIAEKAAREFVEQIGADAVVILWTVQNKRMTKFWRHQIGNGILCNALVCLAVWLTLGGRSVADKILAIIFPRNIPNANTVTSRSTAGSHCDMTNPASPLATSQ
jgi:hypothetical protein